MGAVIGMGAWMRALCIMVLFGCGQPTVEMFTPDQPRYAGDLIERLSGRWVVETTVMSTCASEYQITLPDGQSMWRDAGDRLYVESVPPNEPAIELYLGTENTLRGGGSIELSGCRGEERLHFELAAMDEHSAEGMFTAELEAIGSGCQTFGAQDMEYCVTETTWRAHRIAIR